MRCVHSSDFSRDAHIPVGIAYDDIPVCLHPQLGMELHICKGNEKITPSAFAVRPNMEYQLPSKIDLAPSLHK